MMLLYLCAYIRYDQWKAGPDGPASADDRRHHEDLPGGGNGVDQGGVLLPPQPHVCCLGYHIFPRQPGALRERGERYTG